LFFFGFFLREELETGPFPQLLWVFFLITPPGGLLWGGSPFGTHCLEHVLMRATPWKPFQSVPLFCPRDFFRTWWAPLFPVRLSKQQVFSPHRSRCTPSRFFFVFTIFFFCGNSVFSALKNVHPGSACPSGSHFFLPPPPMYFLPLP